VLADDHAPIRSGLRRVLDLEGDLTVVGEAPDVEAALALTEIHQPAPMPDSGASAERRQ
jgi:DNA-binding NarL/FixJ family response regulator